MGSFYGLLRVETAVKQVPEYLEQQSQTSWQPVSVMLFYHSLTDMRFYCTLYLPCGVQSYFCWLVRVSLFIELGCPRDLGTVPWHFYDK